MKLLYFFIVFSFSASVLSKEVNDWPKSSCESNTVIINMKHIAYCVDKATLHNISFLSMGSNEQSVVISDEVNDLFISLNPPEISISDLHKKYGISIHNFFMALYHENNEIIKELDKVKQAFDLNGGNSMSVFKKGNLFAFVIVGLNDGFDTIYLNKIDNDIIYQITGEFDQETLLKILSNIQYKKT